MQKTILIADNDAGVRHHIQALLQTDGYLVEFADNRSEVFDRMKKKPHPSLVIVEPLLSDMGGVGALQRLRDLPQRPSVLVLSGHSTPENIVRAMQSGASDYLVKPFEGQELRNCVSRLIDGTEDEEEAEQPERTKPFIAVNEKMLRIQETIFRIAGADVPVLIEGESGVGKEVVARSIHALSNRSHKPFVKINCSAVPSELLESELFGYQRGAFTGAFTNTPGKFELANQGTIFLDEISEMKPALQAKLLQVLQDHQYYRLGGKALVDIDVRVLAATNADLKDLLKTGGFRDDLYYRLNVVNIHVPALRERIDDIPELVAHFMQKYGGKYGWSAKPNHSRLMAAMEKYSWPGNVRELENLIRRYFVLEGADSVIEELEDFSRTQFRNAMNSKLTVENQPHQKPFQEIISEIKQKAESDAILRALNQTNWNRKQAAKLLNVSYKSLLYRMGLLKLRAAS